MLAKHTTDKQRYWLKHVKAADLSDGTITEYAATNTISLKSLYTVKRHRGQSKTKLIRLKLYRPDSMCPESNFVPVGPSKAESTVSIVESVPVDQSGCTVTMTNGTRIDFHGELSTTMIQSSMTSVSQAH